MLRHAPSARFKRDLKRAVKRVAAQVAAIPDHYNPSPETLILFTLRHSRRGETGCGGGSIVLEQIMYNLSRGPLEMKSQAMFARPVEPMDDVAAELRHHDRDRFLATLWAPEDRRGVLLALLAFALDIARLRETVSQPMLAQIRLQWWREAFDEVYRGLKPRRHPILEALAPAIWERRIDQEGLMAMLDARERDWEAPPETLAALEAYGAATAGQLAVLRLGVLGAASPEDGSAGRDIGTAWALAGLIRAIPFQARLRRLSIPAELAAATGLDAETVFAGRSTPALCLAVARLAEAAQARLKTARHARRAVSPAGRPVFAEARLASAYLRRIADVGHDPFDARLAPPDPLAAWRLGFARLTGRY